MITNILDDCDLKGKIANYVNYMFATTTKQIAKHSSFDNFYIHFVRMDCITVIEAVADVKARKKILEYEVFSFLGLAKFYSDVTVYFDDLNDIWRIQEGFDSFCLKDKTVGGLAVHADEIGEAPHVHILYVKNKTNKSGELAKYLRTIFFAVK